MFIKFGLLTVKMTDRVAQKAWLILSVPCPALLCCALPSFPLVLFRQSFWLWLELCQLMNLFTPHLQRLYNHVISQLRLSNMTHIGMSQTNFNNGQIEYEMKHISQKWKLQG